MKLFLWLLRKLFPYQIGDVVAMDRCSIHPNCDHHTDYFTGETLKHENIGR